MAIQPAPAATRFQYCIQIVSETFSSAYTFFRQRLNVVREKIPVFQENIQHLATSYWNHLSPASQRYIQLVCLRDAGKFVGLESPYEKNLLEEIGDWILYPTVDLPPKLRTYQRSPIAIGLAATAGALFSLKLIFHPIKTVISVGSKVASLFRLTCFVAEVDIIGLACRSLGRMTNSTLMDRFHSKGPSVKKDDSFSK